MLRERVAARGDPNVAATHTSTLELTTDDWLTPAGDCIVGIEADHAPVSFDERFVDACQDAGAQIALTLLAGDQEDRVTGRGDPALTFASDRSFVCRTSTYVDARTVMLEADGAAADLDRAVVQALQDGADLQARLEVHPP